ncbi:hypothetical protein [Microbacterium sp. NPDC056234]|uniref:hypothetical protein n=1 Tax=Microbacterium sp. NPDC056234 TaxID=3345757 RepID=UPI0035E121EA
MTTNSNGGHEIPLTPPPSTPDTPVNAAPATASVPPAGGPVPPPAGPARPASGAGRPIGIVLAVIGGVALLGSGATAAFAAGDQLTPSDSFATTDAAGIQALDMEVGASDVIVEFGDVDEAELRVEGGSGGAWTIERDEDELIVRSPNRTFGWWFGGWWGDDEHVVLTLPENLQSAGLDLDLDLGAGSLEASGDFGEVDLHVGAGALTIEGSATSVDADISAGRAEIELADVREADFGISAGRLTAELTGTTPNAITFEVSAGSLQLTVPDDVYNVTQEVSAGSFDNRVETSTSASSTIDAKVSAGSATVRSGD